MRQAGSALTFFSMAVGALEDGIGGRYLVKRGMSGISEAMMSFVHSRGVETRNNSPGKEIIVEGGQVAGVRLESGKTGPKRAGQHRPEGHLFEAVIF